MKLLRTKFRRAVFRCFQEWYRDNRQRFLLPLRLTKKRDGAIELSIGDIPVSVLTILLARQMTTPRGLECAAYFFFDGECIDSMCWLSATPRRQGHHVVCSECAGEGHAEPFLNTEMLWREHVFDNLLDWINNALAPMARIDCFRNSGCTWVKLCPAGATLESPEYLLASYEINPTLTKTQCARS